MWWHTSWSIKTAPQNRFSLWCQKGHKHTRIQVCASKSVTYLCLCELKVFQHKSKHCSKYKREAEEQKQRHTQTHRENQTWRIQCDRGRAAQRLRHTAQTGIKELESKERIKEGEPNHLLLYSPTSETRCQSSDVFLCIYILHLGVRVLHCCRGNRHVQGRKSTLFQKNKQSKWTPSNDLMFSLVSCWCTFFIK